MRRMHGMKLSRYLLPFGLIIALAISLMFSYLIWINPATTQSVATSTSNSNEANSIVNTTQKKFSDIYIPTSIVFNAEKKIYQLSNDNVDLTILAKNQLANWKYGSVTRKKELSQEKYQAILEQSDAIVLSYSSSVTLGALNKVFGITATKYNNAGVSRIVVPLTSKNKIYLLNDAKQYVYTVKVKKSTQKKLLAMTLNKKYTRTEITYQKMGDKYIRNYTNGIRISQYSYLLNKETAGLFVTRLLGTNSSGSITTKEQTNETTYTDSATQRLTIKKKTGAVTYANYSSNSQTLSFNDYLNQGFYELKNIGVSLDDVRFANYDSSKHTVTFRNYISGYPVIADNNDGLYSVQLSNSGAERLEFSVYTLQIPVPAAGSAIELPATNYVIKRLLNYGYDSSKIKDIEIGYTWNDNVSSSQVIDLKPTYFVKYNGEWIDYEDMLNADD